MIVVLSIEVPVVRSVKYDPAECANQQVNIKLISVRVTVVFVV